MLCPTCAEIFRAPGRFHGQHQHHLSSASLDSSAEAGCYICVRLADEFSQEPFGRMVWDLWDQEDELAIYFYNKPLQPTAQVRPISHVAFRIVNVGEAADDAFTLGNQSLQRWNTGHLDVSKLIAFWFNSCLAEHDSCVRNLQPTWYPTRLLDISMDSVRLIHTREHVLCQPYATLSYCWGTQPFTVLTSDSLAGFVAGVHVQELPRAFHDAVVALQRLQIQYLWIDAYCIVQSGPDGDWLTESGKMTQVYSNSILNIGVAHASGPLEGAFATRGSLDANCLIRWTLRPGEPESTYHIFPYHDAMPGLQFFGSHQLFTRGWVMQERILCPRMLHFGKDQVYWECSSGGHLFACEQFPIGAPPPQLTSVPWSLEVASSKLGNSMKQPSLALWADVIAQYSSLNFTKPEDKLVALGGMAQRMASVMDDEYVAGFFQGPLLAQLTWHQNLSGNNERYGGKRARRWRAPSWSWASVDRPLEMPKTTAPRLCQIVETDIVLSEPNNRFGALKSATLTLRCRPILVELTAKHNSEGLSSFWLGLREYWWHCDDFDELEAAPSQATIVFTNTTCMLHRAVLDPPGEFETLELEEPVKSTLPSFLAAKADYTAVDLTIRGLVLHQEEVTTYRRLGAFEISHDYNLLLLTKWHDQVEQTIHLI